MEESPPYEELEICTCSIRWNLQIKSVCTSWTSKYGQ